MAMLVITRWYIVLQPHIHKSIGPNEINQSPGPLGSRTRSEKWGRRPGEISPHTSRSAMKMTDDWKVMDKAAYICICYAGCKIIS